MAAFALQRYRFFGKQAVSLLIILPIALPGHRDRRSRSATRSSRSSASDLSVWSLVIAHATFCIVVVFNNVVARLRRLGGNIEEASMDLGATRWTTFRLVTLPNLGSALLAGGLLAFALVVRRDRRHDLHRAAGHPDAAAVDLHQPAEPPAGAGRQRGGGGLIVLSLVPIYLTQKLSGEQGRWTAVTAAMSALVSTETIDSVRRTALAHSVATN